jgi:Zn-finger nucleic acid-binding protein
MVRNQMQSGPGVVEWSIPEDDIGDVRASVPLREHQLGPDDARVTWCPVCEAATAMRAAVASDGRRFDFCPGCGLLWRVDRRLRCAVAHRVMRSRAIAPAPSRSVPRSSRTRSWPGFSR